MSDLQQFANLTKSQKIKQLIKEANWKAILLLDEPLDFAWSKEYNFNKNHQVIIDYLNKISPMDESGLATLKFNMDYEPEDIDLRLVDKGLIADKLHRDVLKNCGNGWSIDSSSYAQSSYRSQKDRGMRWINRLVHLHILDQVVAVGTFNGYTLDELLKILTEYDTIIRTAKISYKYSTVGWVGIILDESIIKGDCEHDSIKCAINHYIGDDQERIGKVFRLSVTYKRYRLVGYLISSGKVTSEHLIEFLQDDDVDLLKLCFSAITTDHISLICSSGWIRCAAYVKDNNKKKRWPNLPSMMLLYSAYCDDDSKRATLFALFPNDVADDAIKCIRNKNLRPLHRLKEASKLPDLSTYLSDDTLVNDLLELGFIDHTKIHKTINDEWADPSIIDKLDRCCMPYAAIRTDKVFYALQETFGHSPICNFYRACIGRDNAEPRVHGTIDFDLLVNSDPTNVINMIIKHHALPEENIIKYFRSYPRDYAIVVNARKYRTFHAKTEGTDRSDIVLILPFNATRLTCKDAIILMKSYSNMLGVNMVPHIKDKCDMVILTNYIMQKDLRDIFILLGLARDMTNLRLAMKHESIKLIAFISASLAN